MTLVLIPAAQLGLVNDPDTTLDPLPGTPGYSTVDECANCAASAATVEVLRAEVARLRALVQTQTRAAEAERLATKTWRGHAEAHGRTIATLRAERLTFAERTAVLEADELGRDEAPRSGAADDIALRLVASEQEAER